MGGVCEEVETGTIRNTRNKPNKWQLPTKKSHTQLNFDYSKNLLIQKVKRARARERIAILAMFCVSKKKK